MLRSLGVARVVARLSMYNTTPYTGTSLYSTTTGTPSIPSIEYSEFGDPSKVLTHTTSSPVATKGGEDGSDDVTVSVLASPVNPADINTIQGVYPSKPSSFPAVPGNEGVGYVAGKGRVISAVPALGWWRESFSTHPDNLLFLDEVCEGHGDTVLTNAQAATMTVNPTTALRMLSDFVPGPGKGGSDGEGRVFIQNGATSAVGRAAIQIGAATGWESVNVIRARESEEETEAVKDELKALGATEVLTEEEAAGASTRDLGSVAPSLALNCVGGRSSITLAKHLSQGGTLVTYGGMSMRPVTIPTGLLIFKDISVVGFWMTRWNAEASREAKVEMYRSLVDLVAAGKLSWAGPSDFNLVPFGPGCVSSAFPPPAEGGGGAERKKKALFVFPSEIGDEHHVV